MVEAWESVEDTVLVDDVELVRVAFIRSLQTGLVLGMLMKPRVGGFLLCSSILQAASIFGAAGLDLELDALFQIAVDVLARLLRHCDGDEKWRDHVG